MTPLTTHEAAMLAAVKRLTRGATPPTLRDLQAAHGLANVGSVHRILSRLKAKGYVDWEPRQRQSLRIVGDEDRLAARSADELRRLRARIDRELAGRGERL